MRPKVFIVTASAAGNSVSPVYPIDIYPVPTNIGVGVDILYGIGGSAGYTVQHTFEDPWSINLNTQVSGHWHNNATLVNQTTDGDTNYAFPPRALRILVSAAVSAQIRMTIDQAGPR